MNTLPESSVYVTRAAADAYARFTGGVHEPERARRKLTGLLCGAMLSQPESGNRPALYRHRSRTTQLDIAARVVREGALYVVVSLNVRDYR